MQTQTAVDCGDLWRIGTSKHDRAKTIQNYVFAHKYFSLELRKKLARNLVFPANFFSESCQKKVPRRNFCRAAKNIFSATGKKISRQRIWFPLFVTRTKIMNFVTTNQENS